MSADPSQQSNVDPQSNGSRIPAILGGVAVFVGILAFVAWPREPGDANDPSSRAGDGANAAATASAGTHAAGIATRRYDDARPGTVGIGRSGRLKTAMAEQVPAKAEAPPSFASPAEERAWYENRLVAAKHEVAQRQKFVERLGQAKAQAEKAADREAALAEFEARKQIVERNLEEARQQVAQVEAKLAQLGNGNEAG